jgi:hypothetical protein
MAATVGTSQLAAQLGISRQRINELARKGKVQRERDGRWDPEKVKAALGRNLDIHQKAPSLTETTPPAAVPAEKPTATPVARVVTVKAQSTDGEEAPQFSLAEAQLKHELAKASRAEYEVARLRGILIDAEEASIEWQRQILAARKHALQVPGKLAPKVAAESDVLICQHLIEREIRAMLTELSEYRPNA